MFSPKKYLAISLIAGVVSAGGYSISAMPQYKGVHPHELLAVKGKTPKSNCYGQTDQIHQSTHFPLTVNVIARTVCPREEVTVKTTISRVSWWIFTSVQNAKSNSGFGKTQVNISLPCKKGERATYKVWSEHSASGGMKNAVTFTSETITC
jgi:hypothetical protein